MTPLEVMQQIDGTRATTPDNPVIMAWPKAIADAYPEMKSYCANYTHDTISWCGLTIAYCMVQAGIKPVFGPTDTDRFLWALAWREFGTEVPRGSEQPGDVLVFLWRTGGHHVTLYQGKSGSNYVCHGGNQSHAVNVQSYPQSECVAIRRPAAVAAQLSVGAVPTALPTLPPAVGLPPLLGPGALLRGWVLDAAVARIDQEIASLQAFRTALTAIEAPALPPPVASPPVAFPLPAPGIPLPDFLNPKPPAAPPQAAQKRFSDCVALTLKWEGGNDDDPRDPGGRTSRGITQTEWDKWRQAHSGLPSDVWQAPQDQVLAIYKANYWDPLQCDSLPAGVDYTVFDYGVNSGNSRPAKALQGLVGVPVDGEIGPQTLAATAQFGATGLINGICDQRITFLKGLKTWPTFGRGWTTRVQGVRSAAVAMVTATPGNAPKAGAATMNPITSSPITTTGGGLVITGAIGDLVAAYVTKDASRVGTDVLLIMSGITALFAKDFNTTGGTK